MLDTIRVQRPLLPTADVRRQRKVARFVWVHYVAVLQCRYCLKWKSYWCELHALSWDLNTNEKVFLYDLSDRRLTIWVLKMPIWKAWLLDSTSEGIGGSSSKECVHLATLALQHIWETSCDLAVRKIYCVFSNNRFVGSSFLVSLQCSDACVDRKECMSAVHAICDWASVV